MRTLQAQAAFDQCAAIRKEANDLYDLMDHCLTEGEWEGAADLLDRANRLMALAARLEMRQSVLVAASDATPMTELEALNQSVGLVQ